MAYTTLEYYTDTYKGRTAADATVEAYIGRGADDIDIATMNRIDTSAMSEEELEILAKANCAQAEAYVERGTTQLTGSVSLGSFSMSGESGSFGPICKRAAQFLAVIGLLDRSVASLPARDMQDLHGGGVVQAERW